MKKEDIDEFTQKISSNGSSLCTNIPKPTIELLKIKKGNLVKIRIEVKRR